MRGQSVTVFKSANCDVPVDNAGRPGPALGAPCQRSAAKDNAGNKAESAWDEIVLPPKIELADNENSYIEEENGKKNTVTELKFNNYKENSQYYEKLKLNT